MEQSTSHTMEASNSFIASKDVKKFYSQKCKKPMITKNVHKVHADMFSQNKCSVYPVVKLNEIEVPRINGIPLNVRVVKRKYDEGSVNGNTKYKAGVNKATGGRLKELPVTDGQNDSMITKNVCKVHVDKFSKKKCSLYPVVKLYDIKMRQHKGIPLNVRVAKRKYDEGSSNGNTEYKAGINKATGGHLKELPVTDGQNNSIANTNMNNSSSGNDYNSVKAISSETNPLLTPLIPCSFLENKPPSTISDFNLGSTTASLKPESESSTKNVYYHDSIFWTTNLYNRKKQQPSKSQPSLLTKVSIKDEKMKSNLNNNSKESVIINYSPKINNINYSSPSSNTSSPSSTYTSSISANKNIIEYTSKKENVYGDLSLFVDKTDINSDISSIKDNEKELSSQKGSCISRSEPNNVSINEVNNSVICSILPSTPQDILDSPQLHNITPSNSTPLQLPLKENGGNTVAVTYSSRPSTPIGIPDSPQFHNITPSNLTPLQLPLKENGGNAMAVTCISLPSTPIGIPDSPQFHNITPSKPTPLQLPLKECSTTCFVSVPNILSEDSVDDSKHDLDSSLSSIDSSSTSTANTSLEDYLPEKTDKVISNKVKNKGNSNKKSRNKSDTKKTRKVTKSHSIMKYFDKIDSTKKKKYVIPGGDEVKSAVVDITKEKKKGVLTVSELNPMFDLPVSPRLQHSNSKGKNVTNNVKKAVKANKMEQMYIDIGQKNFGHVKCPTCGMIYTKSQDDDEAQHARFHQKVIEKLNFKGWKSERVVQEFHDGRIIMISSDDHPSHLKKLSEVKEVVDAELGFVTAQNSYPKAEQQAFLFVMSRKIIGCAIALSINKAYPVIPHSDAQLPGSENSSPSSSWCCSTNPVSALCGISRVWVFSHNRRQKIATRLVDCIRFNFLYGCVIPKEKVAFSDPTPNGRSFAEKYTGKRAILVFR